MSSPPNAGALPGARGAEDAQQIERHAKGTMPEAPKHRGERRAFLIWALMIGAVPPARVVERVVGEVVQCSGCGTALAADTDDAFCSPSCRAWFMR